MASPFEEIEFLARSEHRLDVLDALTEGACDRSTLGEATGASSATLGRILGDFEDRKWIVHTGYRYELTPQGEFIADGVSNLLGRVETERRLRDVLELLPTDSLGFTLEMFADAVVSVADGDDPYAAVRRFDELIEGAETMRAFGTATLKSANVATLHRNIVDGMVTEIIYPPPVIEAVAGWNPDAVEAAAESGNLTVLVHDALPCGLTIFDDRVALTGYARATGLLRIVIDTDDPEALDRANALYETYRGTSVPSAPAETA